VFAPNTLSRRPLAAPLSSADAEQMTDDEINHLVDNPPAEER
jgi:hypothetical protein